MMPGMAAVSPAITAPAPIEISSAGSAQHTKVEALPKRASEGAMLSRQSPFKMRRQVRRHHGAPQQSDSPPGRQDPRLSGHLSKRLEPAPS